MIDDYIKRSKATTNDIKKSHYLDMADQLRDQLAALKLTEAAKFRKGELVTDGTGKEFKVVSVDKNWDLLTVSRDGRTFMIDQNKVTKVTKGDAKLTPKEQEIKELLANGTSPEEVADIMQMPVSKITKFMESLNEADEPSEDEKENEQIIAKADEYRVRLYKDTETVDLLDGEETILVSMPLVIWKQLTRQ